MNSLDQYKHPDSAAQLLARHLGDGTLTLFLGAGASVSFGLPNWLALVNGLRGRAGLSVKHFQNAEELQIAADEVKEAFSTPELWHDAVTAELYGRIPNATSVSALEHKLLIAIAALLMGSKRGHVTRVVSLNFDTMLEWFLSTFGFVVKSVSSLPYLEGSEDVRIYHPHGCLPLPGFRVVERSESIIFTLSEADSRLGAPNDPWFELTRHILSSGFCLFIGMSPASLNDRALSPLLTHAAGIYKGHRPTGVWLVWEQLTQELEKQYDRRNIVSIQTSSVNDICEFVLTICQNARK